MGWSTRVSFKVVNNCLDVIPPFVAGKNDSVRVSTRTKKNQDIFDSARRKMLKCYGVRIKNLEIVDHQWKI